MRKAFVFDRLTREGEGIDGRSRQSSLLLMVPPHLLQSVVQAFVQTKNASQRGLPILTTTVSFLDAPAHVGCHLDWQKTDAVQHIVRHQPAQWFPAHTF
jgi:hypothetical protein